MKITLLLGSVRPGRQSHKAARYVEKQLQIKGVEVDFIDLAITPLPILGDPSSEDPAVKTRINDLSNRLKQADAIIFVTPEYHGSFSGAIKNVLDYYWAEFHRKAIGVVATSSGKMGGINASTQLQHVILSLGAFPLPLKLLVPEVHLAFNEHSEPHDERFIKSGEKFLKEFIWYANVINQKEFQNSAVA